MGKIFISWNIITTSDVIMVVREKDLPLGEVFRSPVYHPPHTIRNITVNDLNPVMHQVEIWTTVDGITLLALKGRCDIDASIGTNTALQIVSFIVDRGVLGSPSFDPITPTDQYVNPELEGKTYVVFKPGYGPLLWGIHIQMIPGGGFKFIDGQAFSTGEEYTILVSNLVQTNQTGSSRSYPQGIVDLPADITFGAAHYNMMLEATGAGPFIGVTILDINTVPDNTKFGINNQLATCKYVVLQLPVGAYCNVRGISRNVLYIGKGETANFIKKGSRLIIINWDGDVARIGDRIKKDGLAPLNNLAEVGGWYLKTDEPRIYYWYVSELPSGDRLSSTDDIVVPTLERGIWHVGATKFWVPDTGGYFERNHDPNNDVDPDAGRASGSIQDSVVGPHQHAASSDATVNFIKRKVGSSTGGLGLNAAPLGYERAEAQTGPPVGAGSSPTQTYPKNINRKVYIIT